MKVSTKSVHESKQLWSVWISSSFALYISLETTELILTGWNLVLLVFAFPFSSRLSNLHRQIPTLPPKAPRMQGFYQSETPLEHLSRTTLQKHVSRQDVQLSYYPRKAPFWTLTQISHEPTHKNIRASTPALPITKQGGWLALSIFSCCSSLQWSDNSPFLNSLQFIEFLLLQMPGLFIYYLASL